MIAKTEVESFGFPYIFSNEEWESEQLKYEYWADNNSYPHDHPFSIRMIFKSYEALENAIGTCPDYKEPEE